MNYFHFFPAASPPTRVLGNLQKMLESGKARLDSVPAVKVRDRHFVKIVRSLKLQLFLLQQVTDSTDFYLLNVYHYYL